MKRMNFPGRKAKRRIEAMIRELRFNANVHERAGTRSNAVIKGMRQKMFDLKQTISSEVENAKLVRTKKKRS